MTAPRRSEADAPPSRPAVLWITAAAIAVLVLHALWYRSLFGGHALDDAYISFRYLEHWLAGHGLVYNPGERVEGYSNFLWVVALAPGAAIAGDPTGFAQLLGVALGAALIATATWSLRRVLAVRSPAAIAFAAAAIATSGYVAAWSVSGLENSLYALALLGGWARYHLEERRGHAGPPWSALPVAGLALTRPEGIFLALGAVGYHLVLARVDGRAARDRATWAFPAVVLAVLAGYHAWRFSFYGPHLWPNTVRAKVGLGTAQLGRGLAYALTRFVVPYGLLLAPVAALPALRGRSTFRPMATGTAVLFGYLAFVVAVGGDWSFGRFCSHLVPLGAVLLAAAAGDLELARRLGPRGRLGAGAGYLVLCFAVSSLLYEAAFFRAFAPKDAERIAIGKWLAEVAPPDTRIAVFAAGEIPFYSGLYAHDMLGLNDLHVASVERPDLGRGMAGHEKHDLDHSLDAVRPELIFDGALVPGFDEHPSVRARYRRLGAWELTAVHVERSVHDRWRAALPAGASSGGLAPDAASLDPPQGT